MTGQEKLPGLQIARAVAALAIAYLHSWHVTLPFRANTAYPIPILKDHGALAVDLFFAISGFVICLMVTSRNFDPISFAIRRVFRLYPLWIVTSLVYLFLTRFLGRGPSQTGSFFLYSLTLLPTQDLPFYDLGWTLQHEIAFYLLAVVVAPLFGLTGLVVTLGAGLIADQLFSLPWYLHHYAVFYGSFLAGIAVFVLRNYAARFGVLLPLALGLLILFLDEWLFGRSSRALLPAGLFLGLIGFVNMKPKSFIGAAGELLGDASYSIYLIHPLIFYGVYILLQPPLPPMWSQEFLRFGSIALVCLLAIGSWKLFESPIIRIGNKLARGARLGMNVRVEHSAAGEAAVGPADG